MSKKPKKAQDTKDNSMLLYRIVGILCAIAVAVLLVINSGILQRNMAAVTINGTKYSAADVQYYYNVVWNNAINTSQSYIMYGIDYGFDYTQAPEKQIYDEATGQTWHDYFIESALEYMKGTTALYKKANESGHTLSEEGQASLNEILDSLDTAWIGTYNDRNAFIRANYGSYMTYDRFQELLTQEITGSDYAMQMQNSLTYTESDYDTYYQAHKDELDTFTISQFALQASVETTEGEGEEAVERSEEEIAAALEQAKTETKAIAQEIQSRLQDGESPENLALEYADHLFSSSLHATRTASSVANSSYSEWALDESRTKGDVTLAEYSSSNTAHMYYVAQFEDRYLDTTKTANVRHILVAAETDEGATEPTQAQYDAAKEKAELLLNQWQSGEATEESFAALVAPNTADTSSAATGGLMENVSTASGYVQTFTDWSLDPARVPGDTGIIQNTGSSVKGWHIMYYVSDGMPVWKLTADNALRSEDYLAWETELLEGYEAVTGSGLRFVA